ncbi:MAG: RluA family pseudouridine synthase [Verrucomicrobiota bacterium]
MTTILQRNLKVRRSESGILLVEFLAARIGTSKRKAKRLIDSKQILVNSRRTWIAKHRLAEGDMVRLPAVSPVSAAKANPETLKILHQDSLMVAIDKPSGLVTYQHKNSVEHLLQKQLSNPGIRAIHRLDKQTTGVLLFSKNEEFRQAMINVFRQGRIRKDYHAIVAGRIQASDREISKPLDDKRAESRIRTVAYSKNSTHLIATILTGRTHQVRRHLSSLGHPVLGDRRYQIEIASAFQGIQFSRQMLHASHVCFPHPSTNKTQAINSRLPQDFRDCLSRLKLTS